MSTQEDYLNEPPRKQGMSSTAKVLIVLGSIAGVCLLACCGGFVFFVYKAKDAFQIATDAADIQQRAQKIIHITVPDDFAPAQGMQFAVMGVGMKWVVYQKRGNPNAILMIMETTQPMQGGASLKQQREQMLRQMQQQGQRPGNVNTDLSEESTETREFTIGGEKVPFEFIKGTSAQGPSRQVVGVFQGRNGVIMVMLIVPESDYDEAAVVRMLESIRLPDDEAEAESMDEPEAHDQPEKDDGAAPADESKAAEKNNEQDPPSESSP